MATRRGRVIMARMLLTTAPSTVRTGSMPTMPSETRRIDEQRFLPDVGGGHADIGIGGLQALVVEQRDLDGDVRDQSVFLRTRPLTWAETALASAADCTHTARLRVTAEVRADTGANEAAASDTSAGTVVVAQAASNRGRAAARASLAGSGPHVPAPCFAGDRSSFSLRQFCGSTGRRGW